MRLLERRRRRADLLVLGALTLIHPTELSAYPLGQTTGLGGPRLQSTLERLQKAGFVSSRWADGTRPRRRLYRLTKTTEDRSHA